jgi:hypothetical protein
MMASHPESFNKSFMQLKEVNLSLLALLNMSIHHKVFWFSNTYKRSFPLFMLLKTKMALLLVFWVVRKSRPPMQ